MAPVQDNSTLIWLEEADLSLGSGASRVHVLKGMSLEVDRGQSVGVVGPSGSGKSTLLMVLGGLERLDSGKIMINGTDITHLGEDDLARFRGRNIGIVFQSFHLIPNMTALENVATPLEIAGQDNAFERAREELEHVGLGKRLDHYPSQLSGGEQQRVAIARALAPDPALLIADEPTGNLDGKTATQITDLLFENQKRRNMTLLLVTHDPSLAERCDRQVKVHSGRFENDADSPAKTNPDLAATA